MTSVMEVGFPRNLNFSGVRFHSRVPRFQSMIGFSVSSQGKPKIRCCFPSPEIRKHAGAEDYVEFREVCDSASFVLCSVHVKDNQRFFEFLQG